MGTLHALRSRAPHGVSPVQGTHVTEAVPTEADRQASQDAFPWRLVALLAVLGGAFYGSLLLGALTYEQPAVSAAPAGDGGVVVFDKGEGPDSEAE